MPVYLSHVKFTCLSGEQKNNFTWQVTDEGGYTVNPYADTTQVEVSCLGFKNEVFILLPNETKTVLLTRAPFGLNEFVVSASFIPITINQSVYDIKTIGKSKVEEKGANDLREALSNEPIFKTNNGHVNETALNLNGLSGNHVKFMVDGVPVEGRLNGNIDLSQINLTEIEKIEIIEGPSSVSYGTNALGGVVNIITKKHQTKKLDIGISSYYESIGKYNFNGTVGWKQNSNLYKLSGGRNFFAGFANQDTSRYKDWKPREQYYGSFLYSRQIHHVKLSYVLDGFQEIMTSRGAPRPPYYVTAFDTHYETTRLTNKVLLNGRIAKHKFIDLTLSYAYYQRSRNIYFKDLTTLNEILTPENGDQDTTTFHNYLFRGVFNRSNDSLRLNYMVGTELKRDIINAERVLNHEQEIGDYAIFGNVKYQPIKTLTIQPGIRYAYNTKYQAPLVPSVNFMFDLNNDVKLKAAYARGFRAPSLKELYLEFHYNSTINLYGNEDLNAENSDHINLSIDYSKKIKDHQFKIIPKVYYSKINDLIVLVQSSPIDWIYYNVDFLITKGAALNLHYDFQNFSLNTAYSYYGNYNSQFDDFDTKNKYFFSNDVSSDIGYQIEPLNLKLCIYHKYTGSIQSFYINDNNEIEKSFIGNYHTLDATVTKKLGKEKVTVVGGVKNLFDVTQVKMSGEVFGVSNQNNSNTLDVLWGRSYFISLTLKL